MDDVERILSVLRLAERLKSELRHSWLSSVEAIAGDVPFFETGERKAMKRQRELEAIEEIRATLPEPTGELVAGLWHEFEARATAEAKLRAGGIDPEAVGARAAAAAALVAGARLERGVPSA